MKIKTGTVVVKVKREMYAMSVWKKWKDKGESLLSDFTFKQGAANCSLLALGFPLQTNNHK